MPTHNDILIRRVTGDKTGDGAGGFQPWLRTLGVACVLLLLTAAAHGQGTEIHSNGRGGGPWSEPDTWHGQRVPGPEDTVVIAMRDQVLFDRNDRDQATCRALYLDPEAVLRFSEGRQARTLTVAGPIESYGTIQMDATGDRRAEHELRLVGEGEEERTLHLLENGALLVYGYEEHRRDSRTARITAASLDIDGAPDAADGDADGEGEGDAAAQRQPARIVADGSVMFDLHHAHVHDVQISLTDLDNTGARRRERLNILGNYFTGASSLALQQCDTPSLRDNTFRTEVDVAPEYAIRFIRVQLADVRGNTIEGPYVDGLNLTWDTDSSFAETRISGSTRHAISAIRGENTSLKNLHISDVPIGVFANVGSMALEAVVVARAKTSFHFRDIGVQLTDCSAPNPVVEMPEQPEEGEEGDGEPQAPPAPEILRLESAAARLINSPFEPDEITQTGTPPGERPFVETMQYLVVRVARESAEADPETMTNGQAGADADRDVAAGPSGELRVRAGNEEAADLPPGLQVRVQTAPESGGVPEGRADLNVRNSPVPVSRVGITPMPASQRALAVRSWRIDREGSFLQSPFYELMIEVPTEGNGGGYETLVRETLEPSADWFRPEPNDPEPTIEVILP